LSCTTACTLLLALGVRLVLLAVVAETDVKLDVVAEVMGIVVFDGVHIGACVRRAAGASCRVVEADVALDVAAVVMGIVVYDGVHDAACVGRAAGAACRRG